jgi:hypothetical protein
MKGPRSNNFPIFPIWGRMTIMWRYKDGYPVLFAVYLLYLHLSVYIGLCISLAIFSIKSFEIPSKPRWQSPLICNGVHLPHPCLHQKMENFCRTLIYLEWQWWVKIHLSQLHPVIDRQSLHLLAAFSLDMTKAWYPVSWLWSLSVPHSRKSIRTLVSRGGGCLSSCWVSLSRSVLLFVFANLKLQLLGSDLSSTDLLQTDLVERGIWLELLLSLLLVPLSRLARLTLLCSLLVSWMKCREEV